MVDNTKWDTFQVIANGVLERPPPRSSCPEGVSLVDAEEGSVDRDAHRKGLEAGGLSGSMYYGCWTIWKTDAGFSGELMQYRNCTGHFENVPLETALDYAEEWTNVSSG